MMRWNQRKAGERGKDLRKERRLAEGWHSVREVVPSRYVLPILPGDRDTLTVTVRGSTAVPVLPIISQFLLALLLVAAGARFNRRRRD